LRGTCIQISTQHIIYIICMCMLGTTHAKMHVKREEKRVMELTQTDREREVNCYKSGAQKTESDLSALEILAESLGWFLDLDPSAVLVNELVDGDLRHFLGRLEEIHKLGEARHDGEI